jgi:GH18 family chitinase
MKKRLHTATMLTMALLLAITTHAQFKVVGYVFARTNILSEVKKVNLDKITHLNLAFINPDPEGNFKEIPALDTVMQLAHSKNVKVLMSCGGGSSHAYYARLLTSEYRKKLVTNFIEFVDKYNLDGIDVDLEGNDIDSNYQSFVVDLRKPLAKRDKLLTAAVAWWTRAKITDKALMQFDFINVMAYDKTGPWKPEKPGQHSPVSFAQDHLAYWHNERGVKKQKLILGVPFYGFGFGSLPSKDKAFREMYWNTIQQNYPDRKNDDEIVLPDSSGTVYYNGMKTIKEKTILAVKECGGIMIWQLLHDSNNENSLLDVINNTYRQYGKKSK